MLKAKLSTAVMVEGNMQKLPKEVVIAGQVWKVRTNQKSGGCFDSTKNQITVGLKYPQDVLGIFFHEVIEALITMRGFRYADLNGTHIFSMFHDDFNNLIQDFTYAIKDMIK